MHPAFTFLDPDAQPGSSGRLAGWLIPAKDLSDVAGMPTTCGSPHRAYVARQTSPFIARLQREGAVISGKTLTSELGATVYAERTDVPVLESPAYPGRTPGGSSTGAAVIVAEGLHRAAHGSDAGGSLRVPAAACEVVGFKPASTSASTDGFITVNVADQVELWDYAGVEKLIDASISHSPRIGILTTPLFTPGAPVDPARAAVVRRAADVLSQWFDVREVHPYPQAAETFTHFSRRIKQAFAAVDAKDNEYVAWLAAEGKRVTAAQLAAANNHLAILDVILPRVWGVDVLLTPTIAVDPPEVGTFSGMEPSESFEAQTRWSPWCSLFNLTGGPAIAVGPVHLGGITADDSTVLALAALVEPVARGWREAS